MIFLLPKANQSFQKQTETLTQHKNPCSLKGFNKNFIKKCSNKLKDKSTHPKHKSLNFQIAFNQQQKLDQISTNQSHFTKNAEPAQPKIIKNSKNRKGHITTTLRSNQMQRAAKQESLRLRTHSLASARHHSHIKQKDQHRVMEIKPNEQQNIVQSPRPLYSPIHKLNQFISKDNAKSKKINLESRH